MNKKWLYILLIFLIIAAVTAYTLWFYKSDRNTHDQRKEPVSVETDQPKPNDLTVEPKDADYQPALWFMDDLWITQVPGGDASHAGTLNFDAKGANKNQDIYAPFDATIVRRQAAGVDMHMVIIQSNQEVLLADGSHSFVSMIFGHDDNISDCYVGRTLSQGEVFYQTGTQGNATGDHVHVCIAKGKWTDGSAGEIEVSPGIWTLKNGIDPTNGLFITDSTIIHDTKGMQFTKYTVPVSFDTYTIENVAEDDITVSVWLRNHDILLLTSIGIQCGTDKNTAPEKEITKNVRWTDPLLNYSASAYFGKLATGHTYYIRYYVETGGEKYYSDWQEVTTLKGDISFDTYEIPNLYESDVCLSAWIDNPNARQMTTGIIYGKSREYTDSQIINTDVDWTRPNLSYYLSGLYGNYLESNTRYYSRYYAVSGSNTYYSDWFDIITPDGGISFDNYNVENISDKDATPSVWLSNPNAWTLTEMGLEYHTSKNAAVQSVLMTENVTWTRPKLTENLSSLIGDLEPDTTYYVQFYVKSDGKKYRSDSIVFKTLINNTTYFVNYNANGGAGAPSSQTKNDHVDLLLSSTKPTRAGYSFKNWNTKADGTGTSYWAGSKYTTDADVTLYAQWVEGNAVFGICGTNVKYAVQDGTATFTKENENSEAIFEIDCGDVFREDENISKVVIAEPMRLFDDPQINISFINAAYVQEMDLEKLDVSDVTNFLNLFNGCTSLRKLNVSSWNTSNITNMMGMFSGCSSLQQIDVSAWNTSNVTAMNFMFYNCADLSGLNVSGWNTSGVTNAASIFSGCNSLNTVMLGSYSLELNIFETLPNYSETWYYIAADAATRNPAFGSVRQGDSLFASYTANTMAGIWSTDANYPEIKDRMILPDGLNVIDESAFEGVSAVDEFVLQDGLVTIGSRAFASCDARLIRIPDSVQVIGEDAFRDNPNLILSCQSDNTGAAYARSHNIMYRIEE